jgi:hypothetical protein
MPSVDINLLDKLLADNELEMLLSQLGSAEKVADEDIRQKAVAISGRLEKLRDETLRGTLTFEQVSLEENRIRAAISMLLSDLRNPKKAKEKEQKKRAWVLPATVYSIVAATLLWWLFQPVSMFRMEADLLVERLSFTYLQGPTDFAQGNLRQCIWQNYATASFDAEKGQLDTDLDGQWESTFPLESSVQISANPDVPGIGLQFGPARLEKLALENNAIITLSRPEDNAAQLRLTVQQSNALKGSFTYSQPLTIQAEQCNVGGLPNETEFPQPIQIQLFAPQGMAREVNVAGFPGSATLDLDLAEGIKMENKNLLIANPSFYKPVENVAVPTILRGEISLAEVDKPAFRQWTLPEGEALDLRAEKLALERLDIKPEGISMHLSGDVSRIETGQNHSLRNPLRIEWLWANQRLLLSAFGIAFIGLAFFLPPKMRDRIFELLKILKGF